MGNTQSTEEDGDLQAKKEGDLKAEKRGDLQAEKEGNLQAEEAWYLKELKAKLAKNIIAKKIRIQYLLKEYFKECRKFRQLEGNASCINISTLMQEIRDLIKKYNMAQSLSSRDKYAKKYLCPLDTLKSRKNQVLFDDVKYLKIKSYRISIVDGIIDATMGSIRYRMLALTEYNKNGNKCDDCNDCNNGKSEDEDSEDEDSEDGEI
jgi:hypothetical protein